MESKQQQQEKLMILQTAIKQLIDEEKKSYKDVLVTDVDKEFDHRLLSKLLSQVETLREDDLLQEDDTKACNDNEDAGRTEEAVQPEKKKAVPVAVIKEEEEEESSDSSSSSNEERREEEIIKELRKVRRQNLITHCLLSVMFVLTVTWQLSEVSMILKVKEGLNHPIRSFGGMLTGILKKPVSAGNGNENDKQHGKNRVIETSVPGISIPEVDLPSLDFDRE